MLHLTRAIDRATGYVFVPPPNSPAPPGVIDTDTDTATTTSSARRPNTYALFSSAAGAMRGPGSDVRDVQERWVDAREEWDAFERVRWRREGEVVRDEVARRRDGVKER